MHLYTSTCTLILLISSSFIHVTSFTTVGSPSFPPFQKTTESFEQSRLYQTPIKYNRYAKYNVNVVNNDANAISSPSEVEAKRLKFMINQMKGEMQESEMRASAAENRVRMLQVQIKKMESSKVETDSDESIKEEMDEMKDKYENNIKKLKKQIIDLTDKVNVFKKKSESELEDIKANHQVEKNEWQCKYDDLKADLEVANIELASSREEVSNLENEIKLVQKNMNDLETLLLGQIEDVTTSKDVEIAQIKDKAEEVRATLVKEIEGLETKLKDSEMQSEKLLQDLDTTKREMTGELIAFKDKSRKEIETLQTILGSKESDIKAKDLTIDTLNNERGSLRKLLRIQGSLVKQRIQKRLGKGK